MTDLREELLRHIGEADFCRMTVENPARIFAVFEA